MAETVPTPIAIRMACMRPEVTQHTQTARVTVSAHDAGQVQSGLTLATNDASAITDAVQAYAIEHKALPADISVQGASFSINLPAQPDARLAGRIAIVTGSGQGFGKGIAAGLAAHGVHIVVADINEETGEATAAEIREQSGPQAAVFIPINVMSGESVEACVTATVQAFGGLDMFIANAGVLKAGGLDEMDESSFDFVTSVNYKGYFLCAQAASAVMRQQQALHPTYTADIIQINSKSGLEGSKRNFAYSGSKFGGIGLTQSFALELVAYGIKVNAICPGNYFEGPLWSDPVTGLFVQYLNAGKVEGAKTLEDVKQFYMSKVPMERGCLPSDVVTAILYLHDQAYETGQALPVSGGQTMLN